MSEVVRMGIITAIDGGSRASDAAVQSRRSRSVLAAAASGIHAQVKSQGGDPEEVFARAGIESASLLNGRHALDLSAYVQMMEIAALHTGNDNFGLFYGQRFTPDMLGLIGAVVLAAPNLGTALTALVDLFPYHQQATETRIVREGHLLRLEYRILDGCIVDRRQDAELTMGMFVNMFRSCFNANWAPEQVYFEHPRPSEFADHARAFRAPVHFGQRTNSVWFQASDMVAPMPGANLQGFAANQEQLMRVAGGAGQIDLASRVKSEIRSYLADGEVNIERVSDTLNVPRWTLQRRLSDSGLTFLSLVDAVRKEMADRYLRQASISVTDIAYLLGYSELSAFSRACRRWYDASPQSCRLAWTGVTV